MTWHPCECELQQMRLAKIPCYLLPSTAIIDFEATEWELQRAITWSLNCAAEGITLWKMYLKHMVLGKRVLKLLDVFIQIQRCSCVPFMFSHLKISMFWFQ